MPAKHEQMRNENTLLVLDCIRLNGQSTRRSIQKATGLSWAAVSNISTELIARRVLVERAPHDRLAGRNPSYLDFVPKRNLTIGVELNAEGLTVLLLDLRCSVVDSRIERIRSIERDDVLAQMLGTVDEMIRENQLEPASLLGIGIAVQGSVDREGTTSLYNSFFRDWQNVPLKSLCESHFGVPVHVMHDPVCIALAEQWCRKPRSVDFALFRLSYGIGMSYIARGAPVQGHSGRAGELGHMVLNPDGPVCSCGNRGCMESYCSIRGLAHRILCKAQQGGLTLPTSLQQAVDRDVTSMKRIVDWGAERARSGDAALVPLFHDAAVYLGIGIANIVSLFNPACIILTGELLDYRDLLFEEARLVAQRAAWKLSEFEVIISEGGRRQASVGAALYFINAAFDDSQTSRLLD